MAEEIGDDEFTIVKLQGLPWEATDDDIVEFFEGLDIVEDGVYIAKTSVGRASGHAFVEFIDNDNASAALDKDKENMGHRYIEIFKSTEEARDEAIAVPERVFDMSNSDVNENATVIRMRGLPYSITEEEVKEFFSPVKVSKVHIILDHMERASGEGYVVFKKPGQGEASMEKHKSDMGGRYIELFRSTPQELAIMLARLNPDVDDDNFLVKMRGLPYSATEEEVMEFFDNASSLVKVHFISDMNGRASGQAFAEFDNDDARDTAMEKNNENLGSRYVELFEATVGELKATLRRPSNASRKGNWRRGKGKRKEKKTALTRDDLDSEMDAYQKKRKVGA